MNQSIEWGNSPFFFRNGGHLVLKRSRLTFWVFVKLSAVPVPGVNIDEQLQLRQDDKRQRAVVRRHRIDEGRGKLAH